MRRERWGSSVVTDLLARGEMAAWTDVRDLHLGHGAVFLTRRGLAAKMTPGMRARPLAEREGRGR